MANNLHLPPLDVGQATASKQHNSYMLVKKIGEGGFGELWLAKCVLKNKERAATTRCAMKFEAVKADAPSLPAEMEAYVILGNRPFLPVIFDYFEWIERNVIVMELLGKSLEDCMRWCKSHTGRMTVKDTIQIAVQLLEGFQYIHSKGYVHRDIKPGNFIFGPANSKSQNQVRIVDFGLAKKYIENGVHVKPGAWAIAMGTPLFMSHHAHMPLPQTRRDDLEAIAYMLIYFVRGRLPWQDHLQTVDPRERNSQIMKSKISHTSATSDKLLGKDGPIPRTPAVFGDFLWSVRGLKFVEKPAYATYDRMFRDLAKSDKIKLDNKFSWPVTW